MNDINIREVQINDAERILEIYSYYIKNTAITFEYEVPSLEEFQCRIVNIKKKYPYLVIEKSGIVEGYAYAGVFKDRAAYDWCCEVSMYISRENQKCGFGKRLYSALEKELESMGILNLYACVGYPEIEDEFLTNSSREFHSRMGYKVVGDFKNCGYKFNRWYHMVWMEKIIGKHKTQQPSVKFKNQRP